MTDVIRNCKFKYRCPMKWSELEETYDTDIRYCTSCKKTVYYCHTDERLRIAILEDHCVAIRIPSSTAEAPRLNDFDDMELGIPY